MKAQTPKMQFTQLSPAVVMGALRRIADRMTTTAPTIQLFHELASPDVPYTQGEIKNQMPASKQIVLATMVPVCLLSNVGVTFSYLHLLDPGKFRVDAG